MADQLWFSITIRNTVVIAWLALGIGEVGDAGAVDGALAALIAGAEAVTRVAGDPVDGCTVQASKNKSRTSGKAGGRQPIISSPSQRPPAHRWRFLDPLGRGV